MNNQDFNPIDELQDFLEVIESFAPTFEQTADTKIVYRSVGADDLVEDSLLDEKEILEDNDYANNLDNNQTEVPPCLRFQSLPSVPISVVDCGIVRLGETENGLVIALRATMIIWQNDDFQINLFRSGPIYLHNRYKMQTLYEVGRQLGKPDFFVDLEIGKDNNSRPTRVKAGVADDSHQYGDRFRNWLERLVQSIAVTSIRNGIILFDGALTLRTRDTPQYFLETLGKRANESGNAIIAISKQSMLQVSEKSIRFWLNDVPIQPCYRLLTPLMRREGIERVLGNVYATRFSALGPTFRMDVKAVSGQSDDEAIGQLFSSTLMRGGYPDILVRAHVHSYFTSPDVFQLQAQAGAKYRFKPQSDIDLGGIFAPFGGRFK